MAYCSPNVPTLAVNYPIAGLRRGPNLWPCAIHSRYDQDLKRLHLIPLYTDLEAMEVDSSQAVTPTTNERLCGAFRVRRIPPRVPQKLKLDSFTSTSCLWHLAFGSLH